MIIEKALWSLLFATALLAGPGVAEAVPQSDPDDTRVPVAGRVIVAGIEEPVEGALLVVGGSEVVTGPDGRFRLLLAPGTWAISLAAEGFLNDTVHITVGKQPIGDLQVLLRRSPLCRDRRGRGAGIQASRSDASACATRSRARSGGSGR